MNWCRIDVERWAMSQRVPFTMAGVMHAFVFDSYEWAELIEAVQSLLRHGDLKKQYNGKMKHNG